MGHSRITPEPWHAGAMLAIVRQFAGARRRGVVAEGTVDRDGRPEEAELLASLYARAPLL